MAWRASESHRPLQNAGEMLRISLFPREWRGGTSGNQSQRVVSVQRKTVALEAAVIPG
jgi:hypothetical protein